MPQNRCKIWLVQGRYGTHFAISIYDNMGELARYNVFKARRLVRHAKDGKLFLPIGTAALSGKSIKKRHYCIACIYFLLGR